MYHQYYILRSQLTGHIDPLNTNGFRVLKGVMKGVMLSLLLTVTNSYMPRGQSSVLSSFDCPAFLKQKRNLLSHGLQLLLLRLSQHRPSARWLVGFWYERTLTSNVYMASTLCTTTYTPITERINMKILDSSTKSSCSYASYIKPTISNPVDILTQGSSSLLMCIHCIYIKKQAPRASLP